MSLPDTSAWDTLTAIRDAVGAFYDDGMVPLPTVRYVAPGLPAWDCEQMTVTLVSSNNVSGPLTTNVYEQRASAVGFTLRALVVDIAVVRCVAVVSDGGTAPSVDRMEADAKAIAIDEAMLRDAVTSAVDAGTLPAYTNVALDNWTAQNSSGGFGGGVLRIRLIP